MVSKVKESPFSSIYFNLSIVILICFFASIGYIHQRVNKDIKVRTQSVVTNVSVNNIRLCVNVLKDYMDVLSFLEVADESCHSDQVFAEIVARMAKSDSCIHRIYIEPVGTVSKADGKVGFRYYRKDNLPLLQFSAMLRSQKKLVLEVDLNELHQKYTGIESLNYAYVMISRQGVCLYHPDESFIGKRMNHREEANERLMLSLNKDSIVNINSDYMNIPVYRYYRVVKMGGERWMFTANVPNLGFIESVRDTSNNFLIISLVGIGALLAVFSLEILKWRKDFVHRRKIEQQNMNLKLKEEQYKRTMAATELENLKSGLNPHFLFNSLGSLRVLIGKDPEMAKTFSNKLSSLYRYMLEHENEQVVSLNEELKFTQDYIALQSVRFTNKIVTSISIADEYMNYGILPVSLQLLVENCIKHTVISENTPLRIDIYIEGEMLVVVNNYNPREPEIGRTGKGIENLINRYSFLTTKACAFEVKDNHYFAKIPLLDAL